MKRIIFVLVLLIGLTGVQAATLTCQQTTSTSLSIPQFSSKDIEIKCSASGGTVSTVQITPNADPSTGLSITNTQGIDSSISDSSSSTAKWSVTGDTPNDYTLSYTIRSDGTLSWSGPSTTAAAVTSPAQLTVEYVLPPSIFTPSVETLDIQITNIGGSTANNINLELYRAGSEVYSASYPSSIASGASASFSWTNTTGFNESGSYTTKVLIGDTLHDSATVSVNTAGAGRNLTSGYHLISLKKVPEDSSTDIVLQSLSGHYSKVWEYDTDILNWKVYNPDLPAFSTLDSMNVTKGYWIYRNSTGDVQLNETGSYPTISSIDLKVGYNLIGFPSTTERTVEDAYSGIAGNFEKIWKWDNDAGTYRSYDPNLPAFNGAFGNLTPGEGYWLKMNATDTLTITN